jgi:hypothetical protein
MSIKKSIYYGKTRRKVDELLFEMSTINTLSPEHFTIEAEITGFPELYNRSMTRCVEIEERENSKTNPTYPSINKTIEAWSEFDVLIDAMAYFRQHLRNFIEVDPKIKLFEKIEGNLETLEVDDIFSTHDCVPD